jgi:hypothetical protein
MIVDPDFFDHWRTGMVADALGDPMAPVYIMRLWAHCQERKSDSFAMPSRGLKAQCKFPGDAEVFEAALIDAGYLQRDGDTIVATGWAEKNASLLAAWGNGNKGGRPKKNPPKTHGLPMGSPEVTHGQPSENPLLTHAEPIRVDKRREEKTPPTPKGEPVGFKIFWEVWPKTPRKGGKATCLKTWEKAGLEKVSQEIINHVEAMAGTDGWKKQGGDFVPAPLVYLNQRRWDGAETGGGSTGLQLVGAL